MKLFELADKQSTVIKELLAGFSAFIALAYLLILCPQLLHKAGLDFGAAYTATALVACLATLSMGWITNHPYAVAPSLSLAAFFTYGAVGNAGLSWPVALGCCFCAGIIVMILYIFNWRDAILHAIPAPLRYATAGGIGLFLVNIALKSIGVLASHETTLLQVGSLPGTVLFAGLGTFIIAALLSLRIRGAYLIGVCVVWLLGMFIDMSWAGLYDTPASLSPTLQKLDILGSLTFKCLPITLAFTLVSLFETANALLGLSEQARFLEGKGKLLTPNGGLYAVPVGTAVGAVFGTSPVIPVPEAAAGMITGGRSGLTSIVVSLLFLGSLFLAPLAAGAPAYATAPILIFVGASALQQLKKVNWNEATDALPALAILLIIPLTSNVATGLTWGFLIYPLVKLISGRMKEISWVVWLLALLFGISLWYST